MINHNQGQGGHMSLEGKGFYLWQVVNCDNGDYEAIVQAALNAGLSHVLIKVADGIYPYNYDWKTKNDRAKPIVTALKEAGIHVWGWQYVYGEQPDQEANMAIRRIKELELDGFAIDAEREYKDRNKKGTATKYMNMLRKEAKSLPIALSSYRFPSYHTLLPWKEFLSQCDYNMPQVYWMKSHNPGEQLQRCVREFQEINPYRPIIPTGAAFSEQAWTPTTEEILEFMQTAQRLKMSAINFWSWDYSRKNLPNIWNTIAHYPWSGDIPENDLPSQLISALNQGDLDVIADLYQANAVHVTASRTIQGKEAIKAWYHQLLTQSLPNASFTLTSSTGSGNSRRFTWTAVSDGVQILDGNDTLGMLDDKISYQFSSFTLG